MLTDRFTHWITKMQDKLTNILARGIASKFLGDVDIEVPGGVLRGTSMSNTGDVHVMNIELFPSDTETGEHEDKPVASWKLTLDRTN